MIMKVPEGERSFWEWTLQISIPVLRMQYPRSTCKSSKASLGINQASAPESTETLECSFAQNYLKSKKRSY